MSRMHCPDEMVSANEDHGGDRIATCPVCGNEIAPARMPNHIIAHGEENE